MFWLMLSFPTNVACNATVNFSNPFLSAFGKIWQYFGIEPLQLAAYQLLLKFLVQNDEYLSDKSSDFKFNGFWNSRCCYLFCVGPVDFSL
jgi:hypothetical protein